MSKIFLFLVCLSFPANLFGQGQIEDAQKQLSQALTAAAPGKVFLFDLDDTLFSTQNRNLAVFKAFVRDPQQCEEMVSLCDHVKRNLKKKHVEWKWQDTLKNLGFNAEQIATFGARYQKYWGTRFFTSEWLKHDRLIPGAKAYVQKAHDAGATIFYLTGRNKDKMYEGTVQAIKRAGLPFGSDRVFLELKPGNSDDITFKKAVFEKVASLGDLVAAYENEPKNIMAMAEYPGFEGGKFFFLDTLNSGEKMDELAMQPNLIWASRF